MNSIEWYLNRLSLMSPGEVVYRARQAAANRLAGGRPVSLKVPKPDLDSARNWIAGDDSVRAYCDLFGNGAPVTAGRLLEGRFSFFALKDADFGGPIDWHRDYKSGKSAPLAYGKALNHRDAGAIGDIKYIWEINRHWHLTVLAKAAFVSGDERYRNAVVAQLKSWLKANPYPLGVNWNSSLELGIRLIAWSWVWSFLDGFKEESQEFRDDFLTSVYQHCAFIEKNFSRYSSANNHLIGEAAGLFTGAVMWPCWKKSKRWRDTARAVLIREIGRQTYPDGVNREQAVAYQQFALDFFLTAALLGRKSGVEFPPEYWRTLEAMMDFPASLMDAGGNVPNIGDADDGFAIRFGADEGFDPYRSLLATGAVLFERGDFKTKSGGFDEKAFWYLGAEGRGAFDRLEARPAAARDTFPDGGYFILCSDENTEKEIKCVVDCGPLGYLSIAAHGHADALSFTLSAGGVPFLVDPGTYAYHADREWREYFRGTSAHNTIVIDGRSQSVSGGNFMWLKKARARMVEFRPGAERDQFCGEHDGYHDRGVTHIRRMVLTKATGRLQIEDTLDGRGGHTVEQFFHFASECEVVQMDDRAFRATRGDRHVTLKLDPALTPRLVRGREKPPLGWESRGYDVKTPAWTLTAKKEGRVPMVLKTEILI